MELRAQEGGLEPEQEQDGTKTGLRLRLLTGVNFVIPHSVEETTRRCRLIYSRQDSEESPVLMIVRKSDPQLLLGGTLCSRTPRQVLLVMKFPSGFGDHSNHTITNF